MPLTVVHDAFGTFVWATSNATQLNKADVRVRIGLRVAHALCDDMGKPFVSEDRCGDAFDRCCPLVERKCTPHGAHDSQVGRILFSGNVAGWGSFYHGNVALALGEISAEMSTCNVDVYVRAACSYQFYMESISGTGHLLTGAPAFILYVIDK